MIRISLPVLFLTLCLSAAAQHNYAPVDREVIRRMVSDPLSATYYPSLLKRFKTFDTTLTSQDYRLLYYGFVFQPAYNAYADHKGAEIKKKIKALQFEEAIVLCDSVLEKIPVSLVANYYRGLAMHFTDKNDPAYLPYRNRYYQLQKAILSSGNGASCPSAFRIIFVDDEYDMIYNYFEIKKHTSQSLTGNCDQFKVVPSEYYFSEIIFFDTSETLNYLENQIMNK